MHEPDEAAELPANYPSFQSWSGRGSCPSFGPQPVVDDPFAIGLLMLFDRVMPDEPNRSLS
jgi:hypothetical protein